MIKFFFPTANPLPQVIPPLVCVCGLFVFCFGFSKPLFFTEHGRYGEGGGVLGWRLSNSRPAAVSAGYRERFLSADAGALAFKTVYIGGIVASV